ncbi:MAG: hypothetical protein KF767_16390 [Bdellovibrionaceae bacterium]|nr:hypothetical protein [Pseudobdellovibrionaceae bacterium]
MKRLQLLKGLTLSTIAVTWTSTLTGCGQVMGFGDPNIKEQTQVVRSASDEVKLISADIRKSDDDRTLKAASYPVDERNRVLLRLSSLKPSSYQILDQQALLLKIETKDADLALAARPALKLCPLTKNWMMLATWSKAHPYKGGGWGAAGGDFESSACLEPLPSNHTSIAKDAEASFCQGDTRLCFDLKPWFETYVRERQTDFGLILINESRTPLWILGDATLQGPSLFWRRLR